ncbi:acetyltransferase, GNAT family protein [Nostoc commune NIES-4072]|uniref:Acetyltransferase, GNAT family protein n=1 Tax=Nostoc commune NIES-4072 TaxID=2005467 RepID=A0A2R5G586_NOSCO|nr:GNAT family N-acetyltransferase [Nostoc commune]BBD70912.1 acetyltransferase, GNAT family protein [Nostoc commune HK-02]GBG23613.1 acetyltransferase, GNAT family protein [Nostoc commune NIES-4072]
MPLTFLISNYDSPYIPLAMQLRYEVFILEQSVPLELELDGLDKEAIHIFAIDNNKVFGTLRMTKYLDSLKIARVCVSKQCRNQGIGMKMLEKAIEYAKGKEYHYIIIESQISVINFYKKFGFQTEGEMFMDAGIPHIQMIKRIL